MKNGKTGYYAKKQGVNDNLVTSKVTKQLEDEIQHKCYVWFNNNYCLKNKEFRYLIFAVPNGGSRDILEAIKLKNTGVLAGVSDLIIVFDYNVLFVEMKCEGGRLSDVQKDFKSRVEALGHEYIVCYSEAEFKEQVTRKMKRYQSLSFVIKRMIKNNLMFKLFRRMLK